MANLTELIITGTSGLSSDLVAFATAVSMAEVSLEGAQSYVRQTRVADTGRYEPFSER